jgi:hypothetical protein
MVTVDAFTVHILERVINVTQCFLYMGTRGYETDAIEHMANCATGLTLLMPSSHSSMRNSSSFRTTGRRVRCLSATRSVLLVTSLVRSSLKRSKNGGSNLVVKRLAKQRKKRQRRRQLRRLRRSARRRRKLVVVTKLSRLLRRGKMDLRRKLQKRRYQGVWSKSVYRHLSVVVFW